MHQILTSSRLSKCLQRPWLCGQMYRRHSNPTLLYARGEHRGPKFRGIYHTTRSISRTSRNDSYSSDMHRLWQQNAKAVHPSWDYYFQQGRNPGGGLNLGAAAPTEDDEFLEDSLRVGALIRTYQIHGHFIANIDPLGLACVKKRTSMFMNIHEREYRNFEQRMEEFIKINAKKKFRLPKNTYIGGEETWLTLDEIMKRLEHVYCSSIGAEYCQLLQIKELDWMKRKLETPGANIIDVETRKKTIARLSRAAGLETYLHRKWPSEKRFGLEGCEVLIPAMKHIIDQSTLHGVDTFVIGMPHRGRLNVLANVCRKSLVHLFTQFAALEASDEGSGDVKYHLGTFVERLNRTTNKQVRLAVVANPSHLEAADPVVQGKTRAEQFYLGDTKGDRCMSILIHGDAAFAGQGVVFETFCMSDLPDYTTHGTVHIVVNNQIGFTTDPRFSRSSPYCTDSGRVVHIPIFHVNGDDPDAVIHACNIAAEWRATFHKDVIIDLVCYRRNGHNEVDEPRFTQPIMYKKINKIKPILDIYSDLLIKQGVVTAEEFKERKATYERILDEAFEKAQGVTQVKYKDWIDSPWKGFFKGKKSKDFLSLLRPTGVDEATLKHIGTHFATPPKDFEIHRGIGRILKARMDFVNNRVADWALGEALTFGSLVKEGVHVRLSGQDSERGTFSHRHHILHDQNVDEKLYNVLSDIYPDQATYNVCNSSLSEYAVLGFELGYSMVNPMSLVIWEAQFGDFNNTAQCIIDQFICSGESKWVRQIGLVMLLPHAMEGMGPEHSSARLERFLQLSDDDPDEIPTLNENTNMEQLNKTNWIVANCTTPANYFHIMRRQVCLPFRKPLIMMTPKSLLRLPDARSSFDDFLPETNFLPVIPESNSGNFKKLLFCSGKVYYELLSEREKRGLQKDVALVRVEQLTPFPYKELKEAAEKVSATELLWVQEEHKNSGAWFYVQPRLENLFKTKVRYAGRPPSASTATGTKVNHLKEIEELMKQAFG